MRHRREYFTYPLQHLKELKRLKKGKMKDIIKVRCATHGDPHPKQSPRTKPVPHWQVVAFLMQNQESHMSSLVRLAGQGHCRLVRSDNGGKKQGHN